MSLMVLGGAAALYLHGVDEAATELAGDRSAEEAGLEAAAEGERAVLAALARSALFDAVAAALPFVPAPLSLLSADVEERLASRMEAVYPRLAPGGLTVNATLLFARVRPAYADADLASPFGGRANISVPAFVAVDGLANVTATSGEGAYSATLGFTAQFSVPTLLPLSVAARLATETSPGGRAERLAGQFAQRSMALNASAPADPTWAQGMVLLALRTEMALQFGGSGTPGLDDALAANAGSTDGLEAASLVGPGTTETERIFGASLGSFQVAGEPSPVLLEVRGADFANLTVAASWLFFDGQETSDAAWAALRLAVSGSFSVTVAVASSGGSLEVGPIEVPAQFKARAFQVGATAEAFVPPDAVAAALAEVETLGAASRFAAALEDAGFMPNASGKFQTNASTAAVILIELGRFVRAALPPLEDYAEFARANGPEVAQYAGGTIEVEAQAPATAARVEVQVDGEPVGDFPLVEGRAAIPRLPIGAHAVQVSIEENATQLMGGAELSVTAPSWSLSVPVAPVYHSAFLQAALARGEALPERAGLVVLEVAGALVGMRPPTNFSTVAEAAAFAERALLRLEALDLAGAGDGAARDRASDGRAFLKVMVGLLAAAQSADREFHRDALPLGGWLRSLGTLAITGDPKALATVSVDTARLAQVALKDDVATVEFYLGGDKVLAARIPLAKLLLVFNAVADALSLVADLVKIERTFDANSTADEVDRGIVLAGTAVHFASISLGVAKAVYKLLSTTAFAALKDTFKLAGVAVGAALCILDFIALYHEQGGNWTAMWETLVAPSNIGGLMRLPALVGGAVTAIVDLLFLAGLVSAEGGPLGVAASLFVLAGLLVANKEMVASAIFGTLPFDAVAEVRGQVGDAVAIAFTGAASANALDIDRTLQARRASTVRGAALWLEARLSPDNASVASGAAGGAFMRARAAALGHLADSALRLRFAAQAMVEQADDFASPPYDIDLGRTTEGYRAFHTLAGAYNFSGEVEVNMTLSDGLTGTLGRSEWRALFGSVRTADLPSFQFAFSLTDTNGIAQSEFTRWADKLGAAGNLFAVEATQFRASVEAFGPP